MTTLTQDQCADCLLHFPSGGLRVYPHGNICEGCHDERKDSGICREVFGVSPRDTRPARAVPARIDLAVAFPPAKGYRGACTTVADLSRHGLFPGHVGITPTKRAAIRLMIERNMEAVVAMGKGENASRRLYRQRMADIYADVPTWTPTAAELNRMAAADEERFTEGRKHRPFPANLHD